MIVTIEFLAPLNRAVGADEATAQLPEGACLAELLGALRESYPRLFPAADRAMFVVESNLLQKDTKLRDGDRVVMMQVLGGGQET